MKKTLLKIGWPVKNLKNVIKTSISLSTTSRYLSETLNIWKEGKIFKPIIICVPSMIHLARPTVPSVAITIFSLESCFAIFRKVGTDVRTRRAKIMITTGRDCGSVLWISIWRRVKKLEDPSPLLTQENPSLQATKVELRFLLLRVFILSPNFNNPCCYLFTDLKEVLAF